MSAVEKFRSRVLQSASAAAIAARQLSSLDEMAQNDEYVQSEGLNVSSSNNSKKSSRESSAASSVAGDPDGSGSTRPVDHFMGSLPPSGLESLSDKFVGVISTAARSGNRSPVPRGSDKPSQHQQHQKLKQRVPNNKSETERSQHRARQPKSLSSKAPSFSKKNISNQKNTNSQGGRGGTNGSSSWKKTNQKQTLKNNATSKQKQQQNSVQLTVPNSPRTQSRVILLDEKHAHILHQLDYESDSSSGDERDHDLETGNSNERSSMALHDELERELEQSLAYQKSQQIAAVDDDNNGNDQKDPHRFMRMTADLESERETLLKSLESIPSHTNNHNNTNEIDATQSPAQVEPIQVESNNYLFGSTAGDRSNEAFKAGLSWVRNVASPQLQAFSRQIMSKVEENANRATSVINQEMNKQEVKPRGPMIGPRSSRVPNKNKSIDDEIIVTSSSAFLADADRAELERIQNMHSSSRMSTFVQTCLRSLWHNPRLAFIGATLIFALFVYYYSKKRSVDDVL